MVMLLAFLPNIDGQSIQKKTTQALFFLQNTEQPVVYNLRLLTIWLSKKYKFEKKIKADFLFSFQIIDTTDYLVVNFYNRLIHKENQQNNDSLNRAFITLDGLDKLLLWATNTPTLPFDTACQKIAKQNINTNIRQTAHVALAFHWAQNYMDSPARVFFAMYKNDLAQALQNALEKEYGVNDNWLEGLIGLICINRRDLISKTAIKLILNAQNADGGWAWDRLQSTISHPHPTVLAIWILADYEANKKLYR